MTAIDPTNDAAATPRGVATPDVPRTDASEAEATPDEPAEDQQTLLRIEHLPRDVGWMLVYVGVLGFILPGIIGTPFLIAGVAVLMPGGPKRLSRWAGRKPRPFVHAGMKQISRLLDDVERRYPRLPGASS